MAQIGLGIIVGETEKDLDGQFQFVGLLDGVLQRVIVFGTL